MKKLFIAIVGTTAIVTLLAVISSLFHVTFTQASQKPIALPTSITYAAFMQKVTHSKSNAAHVRSKGWGISLTAPNPMDPKYPPYHIENFYQKLISQNSPYAIQASSVNQEYTLLSGLNQYQIGPQDMSDNPNLHFDSHGSIVNLPVWLVTSNGITLISHGGGPDWVGSMTYMVDATTGDVIGHYN